MREKEHKDKKTRMLTPKALGLAAVCLCVMLVLYGCAADAPATGEPTPGAERIPIVLGASTGLAPTRSTSVSNSYQTEQGSNKVFASGTNVDLFITEEGSGDKEYSGGLQYLKAGAPTGTGTEGTSTFSFYDNVGRTGDAVKRYWPLQQHALNFYAFYPAGKVTSLATVENVEVAADQGAVGDQSTAYDLLRGVPDSRWTTTYTAGTTTSNPVPYPTSLDQAHQPINLRFTHLLSKVVIRIKGDGISIGNGSTGGPAADGSGYVAHQNGYDLEGHNLFTNATITVGNLKNHYTLDPDGATPAEATGSTTTFNVKNSGVTVAEDGERFQAYYCLIPPGQQLSGCPITLTVGGYSLSREVPIPQQASAESGKAYIYNLIVGLGTIKLQSYAVTPWTTDVTESGSGTINPLAVPLTFEATAAGSTVAFEGTGYEYRRYTTTGGWTAWESYTATTEITLGEGDKVQFRGTAFPGDDTEGGAKKFIITAGEVKAYGNVMSLKDKTNFATLTTLNDKAFGYLFSGCTALTDASGLLLPAPVLTASCYKGMFNGCTNLTAINCAAINVSATDCTAGWVTGVSATGTFYGAAESVWSGKASGDGIPSGWTFAGY